MSANVLIVDHDAHFVHQVTEALEAENLHVIKTLTGDEALQAFRENDIAAAIVSLMLPGAMTGVALMNELKKKQGIILFAVSNHYNASLKSRMQSMGVENLWVKPIDAQAFLTDLFQALGIQPRVEKKQAPQQQKPRVFPSPLFRNLSEEDVQNILMLGKPIKLEKDTTRSLTLPDEFLIMEHGRIIASLGGFTLMNLTDGQTLGDALVLLNGSQSFTVSIKATMDSKLYILKMPKFRDHLKQQSSLLYTFMLNLNKMLSKQLLSMYQKWLVEKKKNHA